MRTPSERVVAGLRCGEVLDALSDFVDGEAEAALRVRIEEHLRGCDWCERFGNRFSDLVAGMRRELRDTPIDDRVASRLRDRLAKATGQ